MQRILTALLGMVLMIMLGAAKCDEQQHGTQPERNPNPPAARPAEPNNPNVNNPGPVQGDPSAHDPSPSEAEFHAVWKSESKATPKIEYTLETGQAPIPATNLKVTKATDGYIMVWYMYVKVRSGQTIGFSMYGGPSAFHVECMIIHHGQFHSPQDGTRNCASSYTIP